MEQKLSLQNNNYQRNITMEKFFYFFILGTPIIGIFLGLIISKFQ